jgi:hypothetical protein
VCHLIEKLGRGKDFHIDLADGSSGCVAGTIFQDAHLTDELPRADRAEQDGLAIEFAEYVDGTAEYAENTIGWISLTEEDLPVGKVRARHWVALSIQIRRTPQPPA